MPDAAPHGGGLPVPSVDGPDLADLNLVLAHLKQADALKARAEKHLRAAGAPLVTFAVGIELLLWCRKHSLSPLDFVERCVTTFEVEGSDVLLAAAYAMERDGIASPFDAVHLAEAMHRRARLVTADDRLLRSKYPTLAY